MKVLQYKECPNCGQIVPYLQSICDCGRRFSGKERMYKSCPYRGTLNPSTRLFCSCGHFLLFIRSKLTQADMQSAYHSGLSDGINQERQRAAAEWSNFFRDAQLKDTITGQPIRNLEDFHRWKAAFDRIKADRAKRREKTYLLEDKDGFLVRVPESKLDTWEKVQTKGDAPLTPSEREVVNRIVERIYGKKGENK